MQTINETVHWHSRRVGYAACGKYLPGLPVTSATDDTEQVTCKQCRSTLAYRLTGLRRLAAQNRNRGGNA